MDTAEFRKRGYEMIEYVANFMDTISDRDPAPHVQPGYLAKIMPLTPPDQPESWEDIMKDIEPLIMHGMVQWQHPNFHAYFAAGNSWPSVMANILSNATAANCALWETCPVGTELEVIVTDWAGKMLDLPPHLLSTWSNPDSKGGGVIQGSASEAIFLAIISAREYALAKLEKQFPDEDRAVLKSKLIAYANNQSHSCIEKGCLMADVKYKLLEPHPYGYLEALNLRKHILKDINDGLIPFFVNCVLGSTSIGCFDDLLQIGPLANAYDMWLHVDCAYAGSMFSCPETHYLKRGSQYAWSFTVNCNKWMLTNFDCSLMWVKYKHLLHGPLSGYEPVPTHGLPSYRHWGIANTRRFRAVKLWCVLRAYGQKGIRNYCRNHISLAKRFERDVLRDPRFEVIGEVRTGLCCFGYRGKSQAANLLTEYLLEALNSSRKIHMVPGIFQGKYVIRYAICHEYADPAHTDKDWTLIQEYADILGRLYPSEMQDIMKDAGVEKGTMDIEMFASASLDMMGEILSEMKDYSARKSVGEIDVVAMEAAVLEDTFTSHAAADELPEESELSFIQSGFAHAQIHMESIIKIEEELRLRKSRFGSTMIQADSEASGF